MVSSDIHISSTIASLYVPLYVLIFINNDWFLWQYLQYMEISINDDFHKLWYMWISDNLCMCSYRILSIFIISQTIEWAEKLMPNPTCTDVCILFFLDVFISLSHLLAWQGDKGWKSTANMPILFASIMQTMVSNKHRNATLSHDCRYNGFLVLYT